jgi:WD40 repeat protein
LKSRLEIKGHTDSVRAVTFSPDGSKLATGSMDQTVRLWDVRTGTVLAELRGHTGGVRTVAFSPDGTRLASGSMDQTVRLWDPHTGAALAELSGHNHWVSAMTFSPDGTRLATGSMDGGIRLWDAHLRPGALVLKGTKTVVAAVAFGPDGTRLLARDDTGALYAWDRTTGYPLDETEPLPANATAEATTPDGKYRLFILGGQAYYAETARWQEHLREEAARWAEQSRPRPDWHRDQAAKAAAAGQWFAAAFHHRQLARHLADQGDAAGAVAQTKAADALRVRHAVIPETPQPLTKP